MVKKILAGILCAATMITLSDLSVGSAFLIHHLDGRTLAADTIESLLQELSV